MATSSDVQGKFDDLLKCTICLETFKTPKYLPCLHTFCQACIHTYILSTAKEDKSDSITCPVCRRPTPIEGLSKGKLETLAEQLPSNHFVISMMDEKAIQNNEKLCSVCERHSKSQKAISWCSVCEEAYCETCENYHKTFRATSDHTLIALKDIISDVTSSNLFCYVACREHSGKTIELYCKDHSKLCCTLCATVQHRKCEQVVTIDQVISGVKQSTKAKELSKKLTEFSQEIDKMLQARRENVNSFEDQSDDILTQICKARENILKHIEKIERKLRDEVLSTRKETTLQLNDQITELSSYKCTIDNWKAIFDACLTRGSEIHCLAKMEELLEKLPTFEVELFKLLREMKNLSISYEPNNVIPNLSSIGRITMKGSSIPMSFGGKKVNFHTQSGKVRILFEVVVGVQTGGVRYLSGIFWQNNCIIITDRANSRVVYFDDKGKQMEELKIAGQPTDVTKINEQTVAVSASNSNKIYLIDTEPLVLKKMVTINANAWGISFVEDEYIVASSGTISWINATTCGKIRSTKVATDTRFVLSGQKGDYIYMENPNSVKRESAEGDGFTYTNGKLQWPYNYDIDYEGNIYISGHNSKNIHQLTNTGTLVRIINISDFSTITARPWVIRFNRYSNRFLLTFECSEKVLICEIE